MQNPWADMRKEIVKELEKIQIAAQIQEPNQEGLGDFAIGCFELAKAHKKSPSEIAAELSQKINPMGFSVKAIGPYINFYIDWHVWGEKILKAIDKKYGTSPKNGRKAVVDFSSPNPAHPFHMGTVRSTLIGMAFCNILESQGWDVTRLCYINNLGRQVAMALLAYNKYAKGKKPSGKKDIWLGRLYFKIASEAEENVEINAQVEDILRKCEKGDKTWSTLNKKIVNFCLEGFRQNWKIMGIDFDLFVLESEFVKSFTDVVKKLAEKNLLEDVEGAKLLKLEPYGLPSTIIIRSDGTGLYLTRDIASALWRETKLKPDLNIYVVAEDQKLHFRQMFKTLEIIGHKSLAEISKHLSYSMVLLDGKKMSSRKGWFVVWDELLDEGKKKALSEVKSRWPELSEKVAEKRALEIVLAAINFFILKYSPEKPVNFVWEQALAFEGETGPYLQYSHARACAILRKDRKTIAKKARKKSTSMQSYLSAAMAAYKSGCGLKEPHEFYVLKLLAQYPDVLARAERDMRPHYVAGYLYNLADAFNKFYERVPVLRAEGPEKDARLRLVEAVMIVLANGLKILGISAPERM